MSAAATITVDEFQALEQRVLQTVELVKMERAARTAFEAEALAAQTELADLRLQRETMRQERDLLLQERETVRHRVERLVASIDELL